MDPTLFIILFVLWSYDADFRHDEGFIRENASQHGQWADEE